MAFGAAGASRRRGDAAAAKSSVSSRRGCGDVRDDGVHSTPAGDSHTNETCTCRNFAASYENGSNFGESVVRILKRTFKLNKSFFKSTPLICLYVVFLFIVLSSCLFSTAVAESQRPLFSGKSLANFTSSNERAASRRTPEEVTAKGDVELLPHDKIQSRVKKDIQKTLPSAENKNTSHDLRRSRESRGLTWGEYIAKSSEAPALHWNAATETPSFYRPSSETSGSAGPQDPKSLEFAPRTAAANNQHHFFGRTSQKLETHSRKLDLYGSSSTSEFVNPNVVTNSPPIDDEILDKLAHYLLYGSEETKKAFAEDSYSIENRDSLTKPDHDLGSEVDTDFDAKSNTDRKDNFGIHSYDEGSPSYMEYSNPNKDPRSEWDRQLQNEYTPIQTTTEPIDMKKIFQDLADLIEILPDHFEELDEPTNDRSGLENRDSSKSTHLSSEHDNPKLKNIEQLYGQGLSQQYESSVSNSKLTNGKTIKEEGGFLNDLLRSQAERIDSLTTDPLSVPLLKFGPHAGLDAGGIFSSAPKASHSISTTTPASLQYVKDLQTFFRTSSLSPIAGNLGQVASTTKSPFYKPIEDRASSPQPPTSERPSNERFTFTPEYQGATSAYFENTQDSLQTTTRPSIYSSIENVRENFRTSTGSPNELLSEQPSVERFSTPRSPHWRDFSFNSGSRESAVHDDAKPLIFTSRPIFTSNFMDDEAISSTAKPKSEPLYSWTTEPFFSSVEATTQQPSVEHAQVNSPHQNLILDSKTLNSNLGYELSNITDGEDQKKAQKRTLDLLYHMFVDPTTDENGNRRNTLLEDVIKAIDNHIIGDVVALKEHSQSGKKGQSHFKENDGDFFKTLLESIGFDEPFMKSTAEAFSSVSSTSSEGRGTSRRPKPARQPGGARRNIASSSKEAPRAVLQATRPQVRNSSPEIISSGSNMHEPSVQVVSEPHVETLPSGDEFLLTDEFGKQQLITIEDIVSSLTALDDAELSELLGANRRSDQDVERIIARESTEKQTSSKSPSAGIKINNLIVVGPNGESEAIPFDQIGLASRETAVSTTTPKPIIIAAQHLLGDRVPDEKAEFNPTMQAAQHLFGFDAGSESALEHSHDHGYAQPAQPASRPIYTKAPLRGKVFVTIPSPRAGAENPMVAINHQSNLNAYDDIRGSDSTLRHHSFSGIGNLSSLEAEVRRGPHEGVRRAQLRPMESQMSKLPFDSPSGKGVLQSSTYASSGEITYQEPGAMNASPSQLEAQEELQLKQTLALDVKLRSQLEQLQRLQNQIASLDEPLLETITEAPTIAKPVNLHMIPRERIIDTNPDHSNLQREPVRKVAVALVPLHQTVAETRVNHMLKDKEVISPSNKKVAISQLRSSEIGNRRVEASTFRTPTPLISGDPQAIKKNAHMSYIKPEHQRPHNDYRPHITVVENKKKLQSNFDQHFLHANAQQHAPQSGLSSKFQKANVRQPSISTHPLPHEFRFQPPSSLSNAHFKSHDLFQGPEFFSPNSDPSYSYEDKSSPDLYYESPNQDVRNRDYLDISSYGNNEFRQQIIEQQIEEKNREKFASKIYEQVVNSLPKAIHFERTTTAPPVTQRPQIFGFDLPNIFPMPHSHSHVEEAVERKSDDSKDELKWNDPLGLLGLYDYLPFSKKRNEEKNSVIKVTTPKPVSPGKRLQQALEMGNVPPHVSKILVDQFKSKSDGMGSSELIRSADRRQFDRVPQVRYRNEPNSRSYSTGPQVFHPRRNFQSRRRIPGTSRSYPPPLLRARKFGPPNPSSLVPGAAMKASAGAPLLRSPGYTAAHATRPQSSHFGVFSNEQGHGGVSPYEYVHGDSHASEYTSAEGDHHSASYGVDEDHGHHDSPEYDTYLVPLGTKGYKKVQPLFDLSLLLHNVKVKQIGETNESFSFPKVGDPSKFVNIYRPPPHYRR